MQQKDWSIQDAVSEKIVKVIAAPAVAPAIQSQNLCGSFLLSGDFEFIGGPYFLVHKDTQFTVRQDNFYPIDPMHATTNWPKEREALGNEFHHFMISTPILGERLVLFDTKWAQYNFCHLFMEAMSKLLLIEQVYDLSDVIFLIPDDVKLYPKIFEMVGLKYQFYSRNTRYSGNFLIPSKVNVHTYCTVGGSRFFNRLFKNKGVQPSAIGDYIYISRRHPFNRRIKNEVEIFEVLKQVAPFQIIFLEDFPLEEQISILRNAKVIVAPHGAGLTLTILQQQGLLIEIHSPYYKDWAFKNAARNELVNYRGFHCVDEEFDSSKINSSPYRDYNYLCDPVKFKKFVSDIFIF